MSVLNALIILVCLAHVASAQVQPSLGALGGEGHASHTQKQTCPAAQAPRPKLPRLGLCTLTRPTEMLAGYGCDLNFQARQCCLDGTVNCGSIPRCSSNFRLPSPAWGCYGGLYQPRGGPLTQWGWAGYKNGRQRIPVVGQVRARG